MTGAQSPVSLVNLCRRTLQLPISSVSSASSSLCFQLGVRRGTLVGWDRHLQRPLSSSDIYALDGGEALWICGRRLQCPIWPGVKLLIMGSFVPSNSFAFSTVLPTAPKHLRAILEHNPDVVVRENEPAIEEADNPNCLAYLHSILKRVCLLMDRLLFAKGACRGMNRELSVVSIDAQRIGPRMSPAMQQALQDSIKALWEFHQQLETFARNRSTSFVRKSNDLKKQLHNFNEDKKDEEAAKEIKGEENMEEEQNIEELITGFNFDCESSLNRTKERIEEGDEKLLVRLLFTNELLKTYYKCRLSRNCVQKYEGTSYDQIHALIHSKLWDS